MHAHLSRFACLVGAAALLAPAAAGAKPGHAHGHAPASGHASKPAKKHHAKHVRHARRVHLRNYVFQGTLVSADTAAKTAVVHVVHANRWARSFVGQDVTFDLAKARLHAQDSNHDGTVDLADLAAGDAVLVRAKLSSDLASLTQPLAAGGFRDVPAPTTAPTDSTPGS
jgi:hypothetical protein